MEDGKDDAKENVLRINLIKIDDESKINEQKPFLINTLPDTPDLSPLNTPLTPTLKEKKRNRKQEEKIIGQYVIFPLIF